MSTTDQLKDKASEVLISMIDVTVKSMNDVIEFGKQQIPEVIHQLLMWEMTKASVGVIVGILILIGTYIFYRKACEWCKESPENAPAHIGTILLFSVGAFLFISQLLTVLQIWVAPKVFLIQEAANLARGGS